MRLHVNRQVFVYCARQDGPFMLKHLHQSQKTIKHYIQLTCGAAREAMKDTEGVAAQMEKFVFFFAWD